MPGRLLLLSGEGKMHLMVALAPTHPFTVAEYYRMAETGILTPDVRVELLDGQIVDMLPIGPFHSDANSRLHEQFLIVGKGRWIVRSQSPVRLSDDSEPQPDIALVKPRVGGYAANHPQAADVFLLVEVADSSMRFDREEKLPAYARAGIVEYWLLNLVQRVVEVYRDPSPLGVYGFSKRFGTGDRVAPAAFPDAQIAVTDLF
jgi:Uma2 family endonuclease